ncbi:MAG TPA: Ku protein [Gemmatimonadota bacterium]|nr:Ku protein [Gemmatimonadota bacterium]
MPEDERGDEQQDGYRPFWSGTITFGLVSVPVDLLPANRPRRVSLRMLAPDGTPLKREYWSAGGKEQVETENTVHAYELDGGKFVEVTDEELEELAPEKTREIDLRLFVDKDELDPVFFERAYFLAPSKGANKPYRLLVSAMESTGKAGIATFVMREREYLVAIIAENGLLRAETMRFADEIRSPEDAELPKPEKVEKKMVQRLSKALDAVFEEELDPDELQDRRSRGIEKLVKSKLSAGKDVVKAPEEVRESEGALGSEDRLVIDLMEELKRRMKGAAAEEKEPAKAEGPRKPARAAAKKGRSKERGSSNSGDEDLESRSKQELYDMAQELDIDGRSKMTKKELIRAIQKAG